MAGLLASPECLDPERSNPERSKKDHHKVTGCDKAALRLNHDAL